MTFTRDDAGGVGVQARQDLVHDARHVVPGDDQVGLRRVGALRVADEVALPVVDLVQVAQLVERLAQREIGVDALDEQPAKGVVLRAAPAREANASTSCDGPCGSSTRMARTVGVSRAARGQPAPR